MARVSWFLPCLIIVSSSQCPSWVHLSEKPHDEVEDMRRKLQSVEKCFLDSNSSRLVCTELPINIISKTEVALHVSGALNPCDINELIILRNCVSSIEPRRSYFRNFIYGGMDIPGNQVTYLGTYAFHILPRVYSRLLSTLQDMVHAQFWYPDDISQLGLRTFEFITYGEGARLVPHADTGSTYTMTVLLGEAFEGGRFRIRDEQDEAWITISSKRGDAVLFDSEITHYVTEVTAGLRSVLAIELWEAAGLRFSDFRLHLNQSRLLAPLPPHHPLHPSHTGVPDEPANPFLVPRD